MDGFENVGSQSGIFTAAALQKMEFPPINWVVPGVLPEGLTILAGKPKLGKSWLALDMALAVAAGGDVLGVHGADGLVVLLLDRFDVVGRSCAGPGCVGAKAVAAHDHAIEITQAAEGIVRR